MAVPLSQLAAIDSDESTEEPLETGITGFRRVISCEQADLTHTRCIHSEVSHGVRVGQPV